MKFYIGLLILLLTFIVYVEFSAVKPINWTKTYNETHKIPFGTYVFYNELKNLFNDNEIENINVSPYEYFNDRYNWEDSSYVTSGTYIYIKENEPVDNVSAQELMDFASHGNTVFMSTNYIPNSFKDSLNIETKSQYTIKGNAKLTLANSRFKNDSISIEKGLNNLYFSELDSLNTTVLGYQVFDSIPYINYVKIEHGSGNLFLHLQPTAFTNFNLLKKDNKKYTEALLAYLPETTIFYDSVNKKRKEMGNSKLRFILSKPALRYAWYLALLSLIFFMIFNAKRRQRIIKVIKPHENTTVGFVKTIGNLYFETKDHNNLIEKKIMYFLEHIRSAYYLDTQFLDEKFSKNLALKSGKNKTEIKKLISTISFLRAKQNCTEDDLLNLNKQIEGFYKV
ncbi:DUF4350 domain-containing protein [uncultured Lacinutrix sp.]|uniref:DUF4350 domain-containing protein n=1 Tax=uncultured Lacinutrix sp. TaxID=574032 RepID=UPI002635B881|nr:DUF4350 domain-containing protein [uncultured Lacinutrix sp.]